MSVGVLVLAKAPVPGLAKTRLAQSVGDLAAADLAAAALLDTLDAIEPWVPASHRLVALAGDLTKASRGAEIAARLEGWRLVIQRGCTFAERIVAAHQDAAVMWGGRIPLVQVGTDTPQLSGFDLDALSAAVFLPPSEGADAVMGPALDGGWWGLATRRAGYVDGLVDVAMSTPHTAAQTSAALRAAGARVGAVHPLSDVDVLADAITVAALAPGTRFARALRRRGIEAAA